jgi:peptidoglycan/LPS O-acetylase OafA/YrhL
MGETSIMVTKRDVSLDLIRAVAVTLIIFHHIFQEINHTNYPLFVQYLIQLFIDHGAYGVQLFFAVSGYIMIKKYEIIPSIFNYMVLRYTRLVPMLSVIVLFNLVIFNFTEKQSVNILDALPSVLIIDPQIFNSLFNTNRFKWIDNSFWTLFVELRFYLIFGLMIKFLGSRSLIFKKIVLSFLCLLTQTLYLASDVLNFEFIHKLCYWILIPDYFIYFLVGVILYSPKPIKMKIVFVCLLPLECVYIIMQLVKNTFSVNGLFSQQSANMMAYFLFIFLAFYTSNYLILKFTTLTVVANKIGFPSYISYLIHQNLFLFLYPYFSKNFDHLFLCILFYLLVIVLSLQLSKNVEPKLIKSLRSIFSFR